MFFYHNISHINVHTAAIATQPAQEQQPPPQQRQHGDLKELLEEKLTAEALLRREVSDIRMALTMGVYALMAKAMDEGDKEQTRKPEDMAKVEKLEKLADAKEAEVAALNNEIASIRAQLSN